MNQRKVVTELLDNMAKRGTIPGELKVVSGTSDWDLITLGYTSDNIYIESGEIRIYTEDDAQAEIKKFIDSIMNIETTVIVLKSNISRNGVNKHSFKLKVK